MRVSALLCVNALENGQQRAVEAVEAKVGGMAAVHGAVLALVACKKRGTVHEVYVGIALGNRLLVGLHDDGAARAFVGRVVVIGLGEHDVGNVWVRGANATVQLFMRSGKMLHGGRVVVVVRDEYRHG